MLRSTSSVPLSLALLGFLWKLLQLPVVPSWFTTAILIVSCRFFPGCSNDAADNFLPLGRGVLLQLDCYGDFQLPVAMELFLP